MELWLFLKVACLYYQERQLQDQKAPSIPQTTATRKQDQGSGFSDCIAAVA